MVLALLLKCFKRSAKIALLLKHFKRSREVLRHFSASRSSKNLALPLPSPDDDVLESSGFASRSAAKKPEDKRTLEVPKEVLEVIEESRYYYEYLAARRIRPTI